jgi:hypothetical protein
MSAILSSFAALVCLTAGVQDTQKTTLLLEGGFRSECSEQFGVITLRRGSGRLRTARPFSDFSLTFDFRLETSDTEAGVFIRTLTGGPDGTSCWATASTRFRFPMEGGPTRPLRSVR